MKWLKLFISAMIEARYATFRTRAGRWTEARDVFKK
ncbi:hypothetical protein UFOVP1146_139 [uncultured Caudovirales phage]|uniref:Uncharacterized protein n=1 Tax=uncultured Caudovirales phage TaxID=2100421 RepID=A0A6J5P8Y7_9CAUD|nr:hypothetical protein UFOVP812_52 [uncultured Caudovirales phage]CAB4165555.1 hypothetical protein UFOVP818_91 [uncultured Caudovirales phage]CAB4186793.1 hypothetical protein UFOVP1146_139 [uncultured Caudovirales phage]CAB4220442.1 hypothetical protein UFOVP1638_4 [uncultured Caudovirales phage]